MEFHNRRADSANEPQQRGQCITVNVSLLVKKKVVRDILFVSYDFKNPIVYEQNAPVIGVCVSGEAPTLTNIALTDGCLDDLVKTT